MVRGNDMGTALRAGVQLFVRRFGLLSDAETPCGQPVQLSHAHALLVLLERVGRSETTRHKDLVQALGLDKSSVARLCRKMEDAGHVVQARAEDDGRAREVELTAKGSRAAREVDAASRARFDRIVAAMPRAERARVVAALGVLNAAIEALQGEEAA